MNDNKHLLNEIFGNYDNWLCLSGVDSIAKKVVAELREDSERDMVVTFAGSRLEAELAGENLLTVPYNDIVAFEKVLTENSDRILAMALEPVLCNRGLILPKPNFLNRLRRLAKKHNVILLFDETKTALHVKQGSVQKLYGVIPDITIWYYDKEMCFVGLNDNSLVIINKNIQSEGQDLSFDVDVASRLALVEKQESYIAIMLGSIQKAAARYNLPLQSQRLGDMFSLYFSENSIFNYQWIETADITLDNKFCNLMAEQGVTFSESAFGVNYLDEDSNAEYIETLIEKIEKVFSELAG